MADVSLSSFERRFIVKGVEQDFRSDGRSCQDYRYFEVETGIVSNTSGSARLRLVSQVELEVLAICMKICVSVFTILDVHDEIKQVIER